MGQKVINRIFTVLLVVVGAYFLLGELCLPSDKTDYDSVCSVYRGEWKRIMPDGTTEAVVMPGKCVAGRKETVLVETKLPDDIEDGRYLCFRSAKQDMRFYIDGQFKQEYSTREGRLFGRMSAASYVFLKIGREDAGKVLRVETCTDSSYSGVFYTVYYGNPMGVWRHFFKQLGLEIVVAFVTLILSIIAIIASVVLRFCYHKRVPLEYLGWGILVAAVWLITNSAFRQLLFPNLSIINDITFLMIMLLSLPYLLYMNEVQKGHYKCFYQILEGIVIVNFLVCSFLHMTGICDFTDTISYISAFCIISILLLIVTILLDVRSGAVREYLFVAVGMFGVCVAAFVQIIFYFHKSNLFNGMILALGLIFLLVFATISTIHDIMGMEREKQQALQASESKGRFLASMSHEIRTPIHAVLGMDAMILRESSESKIREYALDIQNAGQTLLSLINDILDLSKIESGKLEILPAEYDLSSLIHDVVNMIKMKARDKGLSLELSVNDALPSGLWGDDVRIRQILVNLLTNAVKYTEKGSVTLAVDGSVNEKTIHTGRNVRIVPTSGPLADLLQSSILPPVCASEAGMFGSVNEVHGADIPDAGFAAVDGHGVGKRVRLRFRVEDTGIGIRGEDIEKLYREFERIEEQRNRRIEGTGLGINIVIQLLERMGSRLEVESEYGKGSAFSFVLEQDIINPEPVGDLEQRIKSQAETYTYQALFAAPDAHVLIVDDNGVNRRVFVKLLEATQVQIDEAGGGKECLELVREKKYDLIFLDHMMPEMDGITVLHEMRKRGEQAPVIALTANAVNGAKEMYLKEGFEDFLSKPVNPEKLEKMIMKFLPEDKIMDYQERQEESVQAVSVTESREELPELEGIDWNYARMYLKDTAILLDTLHQFYQTADGEAAQLERFYEALSEVDGAESEGADGRTPAAEMLASYRIKVHSMKNSAAMIGGVSLAGVAKMLEFAARDGKMDVIRSVTPLFLQEWAHMKEILEPVAKPVKSDDEKPEADYAFTKELLHLLRGAIEEMDVDTADEIMEQLKGYSYPERIMSEILEKLGVAVTNLDEEQTVIWTDKFEEELKEDK